MVNLVVQHRDAEYEVAVDTLPESGAIALLVASWIGTSTDPIVIDGRQVDGSTPIREAGLHNGSIVQIGSGQSAKPAMTVSPGVFNRPPRPIAAAVSATVDAPAAPEEPARPSRFGWGALVVPLVLGIAMAVLIHPRMAMFAVFSPAMLAANWMEDRRRHRREKRHRVESERSMIRRFSEDVAAAGRREATRRRSRATYPTELAGRVSTADCRLWERRPHHLDFMELPIGVGCVPWRPALRGATTSQVERVLSRLGELHDVPVALRLGAGDVAGVAGRRDQVLAVARQLVLQAAVGHGPADLAISIFTESASDWDWAKWLPHVVVDSAGSRRLAGSDAEISQITSILPAEESREDPDQLHLLVVDLPNLVDGDRSAIRQSLRDGAARGIAGLALAQSTADLPSLTATIVSVAEEDSWIRYPDGECLGLCPWTVSMRIARETARSLSRLDDPEANIAGRGLPATVNLTSLLEISGGLEANMRRNWLHSGICVGTPIGVREEGPIAVDLVADGPHALLGGTTGSGKSELLRTLVAGLAMGNSPTALNFVLIDYKGGSAFDACEALPHTVGVVTDLDERLAERALMCLGAELRHREARLRAAGVSDIADFPHESGEPLPRLLIVIDEFAALSKELPNFLEALVGVAQRGRSLGVHLLLATQRPAGVITEAIKANTNLRIALRMQDAADSLDVVDSVGAARINRNQPGRGLARLGPDDVVAFQAAIVTERSLGVATVRLQSAPFVFACEQPVANDAGDIADGPNDLELIVTTAGRLAGSLQLPSPRLPWPDPLPLMVSHADLGDHSGLGAGTHFGLADEPHRQRQVGAKWAPKDGNMLLYGLPGSGTTTALVSLVVGMCRGIGPDQIHIYVLDFDDQHLGSLRPLPHVGAVVAGSERERQLRLLRRLADELRQRRDEVAVNPGGLSGCPTIVTVLDNYGAFAAAFDAPGDATVRDLVMRLVADGPGVGMLSLITAKQPGEVPARLASLVPSKLAFRLADRYEYGGLGIPAVDPPQVPGRAFESGTGREIQVAVAHHAGVEAAVAEVRWDGPDQEPWSIGVLPARVQVGDFIAAGRIVGREWFLPLGIGDSTLAPAGLILREGEHALVTGPSRSGKSTALMTLAAVARAAAPQMQVSAIVPRTSPLADSSSVDQVIEAEEVSRLRRVDVPHLLLIDDAELIEADSRVGELIRERAAGLRVVAAGSAHILRSLYGHWTQDIRRSRAGCALRPNIVSDGDLWQTPLPKRGPQRFPAGRGYLLCDGRAELVQLGRH